MRRSLLLVPLVVTGAAFAWSLHCPAVPPTGEVTLMRDEGGCLVGDDEGVRLKWSPAGASVERVHARLRNDFTLERSADPAVPIPLERARELAARFADTLDDDDARLAVFAGRSMTVQWLADQEARSVHLDCRDNFDEALQIQAELTHSLADRVRSIAYRAKLWRPAGEAVDPLLTELLALTAGS